MIIPRDIHSIKLSFLAPKVIPTAVPRGAPKISGDNNPRPTTPYLFQTSWILLVSNFLSSPYLHAMNLLLMESPKNATIKTAKMELEADTATIKMGFNLSAIPVGTASHSSTTIRSRDSAYENKCNVCKKVHSFILLLSQCYIIY